MTISCKTAPRAPGLAQYRPGGGALRALASGAPPLAGLSRRWAIQDSNLGPLPYQQSAVCCRLPPHAAGSAVRGDWARREVRSVRELLRSVASIALPRRGATQPAVGPQGRAFRMAKGATRRRDRGVAPA